jgi:hypothetical protein
MSTWKTFEQPGGGVAVIISPVHDAPATRAAVMQARPTRVTAFLSDHGRAGRSTGAAARAQLQVNGAAAAGHAREVGPVSIEDLLDITVQLAASEDDQPLDLQARLGDEARALLALLAEPCYVAMFPGTPPIDIGALHVTNGQLRLRGASIDHLDYALVQISLQPEHDAPFERPPAPHAKPQRHHAPPENPPGGPEHVTSPPIPSPLESLPSGGAPLEVAVKGLQDPWLEWQDGKASATREASEEPRAGPAPTPVHWNTRLLDGDVALTELFVTVGHVYTIETGLDPQELADALASSTVAPTGLPDRTQVTFELSCPQAILHGHDDAAGKPVARVSHTATYEAATGRCPPARFGLTPAARGRIPLTLGLVTGNAIRASTRLTLQAEPSVVPLAVPTPSSPAARPIEVPAARPIQVPVAVLTGPPAELRLMLTPTDQIVISGGAVTEKPRDPASHPSVLIGEAIRARKELVALSGAYRRDRTRRSEFALAEAPSMCLRMAKVGAALHKQFFGRPADRATDLDVQRLAQTIADTPREGPARLQIAAAFQPFPWAVLYDGAYRGKPLTDDPASVDLTCFWGHRFRIDRMIMGHASAARAPILPMPVRVQACLNPHLDDEPGAKALGVQVVDSQRALFGGMPDVQNHPLIETTKDFVAFLTSDTACELLYVFCHASAAVTRDDLFTYTDRAPETQAKLIFEPPPAPPLDVAAMQDHRTKPLIDRPLVFLNACSTTAGDEAFQAPLLEQFLDRWGAAGVLGTDWEVPSVFADAFARRLLAHFLGDRRSLGEAFWLTSHEAFAEGNPFPLIYALYAQPELTVAATTAAPKGRDHE